MINKDQIRQLAEKYFEEMRTIRHSLHRYPELSNQEYRTSELLQNELSKMGIPFKAGYMMTGILAVLEGKNSGGKTVALRADMDGLPIQEKSEDSYRSANTGIMHACGHDMHMASLLGAAKILRNLRDDLEGRVVFIFQPAEERIPGGARGMIEEGILNEFTPDIILAQHVMPELKTGIAGFFPGTYMASTDELYITIYGKGGHAALPDQLTDSVLIASHIVVALQQVSSRMAPPGIPTVLSFGRIEADGTNNVIPPEVKLYGTFRTMDEDWRKEAHIRIKNLCEATARSMGGTCEVGIQQGYPMLVNDEEVTRKSMDFAKKYLNPTDVQILDPQMTAEDFAYFAGKAPATMYRLGTGGPEGKHSAPLHSPYFTADDEALKTGMGLLSWLTFCFLNET